MERIKFKNLLHSRFLKRTLPFTTLNWRFFAPNQPDHVLIHSFVFKRFYSDYPLLTRILAIGYNLLCWWCWFAIKEIRINYKSHSTRCFERFSVPKSKQFTDLLNLAYLHCIPPAVYYRKQLHQYPASDWLKFVYDFQLPLFHGTLNYPTAKSVQKLLNNKVEFEQFLVDKQIQQPVSFLVLDEDEELTVDHLNKLQNILFFKPSTGHQGKGCFTLEKPLSVNEKTHMTKTMFLGNASYNQQNLQDINRTLSGRQYLIQPQLMNHSDMSACVKVETLTTIRLVTANLHGVVSAESAVLETPTLEKSYLFWSLVIDTDTGQFIAPRQSYLLKNEQYMHWYNQISSQPCPGWKDMKSLALKAHEALPEVLTIGWDMALTETGAVIIEGNSSWSVDQAQLLTGQPMLNFGLGKIYMDLIKSID